MIGLFIWLGLSVAIYILATLLKVLVVDETGIVVTPFTLSLVWPFILTSTLLRLAERVVGYMYRAIYLVVYLVNRKGDDDSENHISH